MNNQRILILGRGGREHAIAHKLKLEFQVEKIFVARGNVGTSQIAINADIDELDFESIGKFCIEQNIHMIIVGPEAPLVAGIYDHFKQDEKLSSIKVFGPSKQGALLEGSKAFAKSFMERHGIPTAGYSTFVSSEKKEAIDYLMKLPAPLVIKADGLAGGKGVIIAQDHEIGRSAIEEIFSGQFNEAGNRIVIEEFMEGIEFSVFTITDGIQYKILPTAKDYKRIGKGDTGLNTGGMGAVSPPPFVNDKILNQVEKLIIQPTIRGLAKEKITYIGFIYFGLMLCPSGEIKVVEYNCRMGDPESQVVFPRIKSSLVKLLNASFDGTLNDAHLELKESAAVTTVLVSGGYPQEYEKGKRITLPSELKDNINIYHSGTTLKDGDLVTDGGRVLSITASSLNWIEARNLSQKTAQSINFEGKYFRDDIGFDLEKF